jgi:hypothetical protein
MFGDDYRPLEHTARMDRGWHNPVWYSRDRMRAMIVAYPSAVHVDAYTLNEKTLSDHAEALTSQKLQSVTIALVKPNDRHVDTILRIPLGAILPALKAVKPKRGPNGSYWLVDEKGGPIGGYYFDRPPF